MGIGVVGLGMGVGVLALLTAGGVGAQPIAMQGDPSACQAAVGPLASVCAARPDDSQAGDDVSYQRMLGHVAQTRFAGNDARSDDSWWATLLQRARHSVTAVASKPATGAHASLTVQRSADVTDATGDQVVRSTPAIERFLIDEWQRSEVEVADSVYHETLRRITATFDSTERAHVGDPERTRILQHLDAILIATNDTWVMFRTQIAERVDSALASHDLALSIPK